MSLPRAVIYLVTRRCSERRFFDQNNKDLPELIELRFDHAPGFEHLTHEAYTKLPWVVPLGGTPWVVPESSWE